ncbi:MAG: DUF502 domain-containing protein [Deltaproteobacteria bacterium]|nr:DUF502 domain-containing protein [Deltaproteobacteria bacterium]
MKRIFKHLRAKILAGVLVILPLGITIFILKFVYTALDDRVGPIGPQVTHFLFHRELHIPGLGIIIFFLLLYLLGLIATNVMGRKLVGWGDRFFTNLPIVKNIYLSSKQLTDAFSTTRKGAFRQAVFVEFPQEGSFVIGFITNEISDLTPQTKVTVFIPTAFVPPMGFLLFLPKERVIPSGLTIEEAVKAIMSLGIVTPHALSVSLSGKTPTKDSIENSERMKYPNSKIEGGP